MSKIPKGGPSAAAPLDSFLSIVRRLTSERKVIPVVTRSGQRARGNFPTNKSFKRARFQSLVERDVLRVLEVSSRVTVLATHPVVLALPNGDEIVHYTPDVQIQMSDEGALLEAKGSFFLTQRESRDALRTRVTLLRKEGIRLVVLLESDVRTNQLQTELEELLRLRPIVGRYRSTLDLRPWDPLGKSAASETLLRRWSAAQQECDALLERVMRRDPDDLISSFVR